MDLDTVKKTIRDIPDFPKKGIVYKDITPLLQDVEAFKFSVDSIIERYKDKKIDVVLGVESRGFIFGTPISYALGTAFVPVRKKGKLPYKTKQVTYQLEYGTDTLEIHEDAFKPGQRVLIVDDLLATGGTVGAVCEMVKSMEGDIVGVEFIIELAFLNGRSKLDGIPVQSLLTY